MTELVAVFSVLSFCASALTLIVLLSAKGSNLMATFDDLSNAIQGAISAQASASTLIPKLQAQSVPVDGLDPAKVESLVAALNASTSALNAAVAAATSPAAPPAAPPAA